MLKRHGVTLLELLVVVFIIGIFVSFIPRTRPDRAQAGQASSNLVQMVQRTRYEAITRNQFVGLKITPTNYQIFVACTNITTGCNGLRYNSRQGDILTTISVGPISDYPQVRISEPTAAQAANSLGTEIIFNPRGLVSNPADGPILVQFTSLRDANTFSRVLINQQGQARKVN